MIDLLKFILLLTILSPLIEGLPPAKWGTCTTRQRKAWHNLTDDEKHEYIDAELCLFSSPAKDSLTGAQTRRDEVQYVHEIQSNFIHDVGAFLPWHRLYVYLHEELLRSECNYTGYQPYWEEVLDVDALNASVVFDPDTGFGGNGAGDSYCITDGPFANVTLHITANISGIFSSDYCLSRSFNDNIFQGATQEHLDACLATTNYTSALECYKSSPHTAGHGGVGGTMLDVSASPGDPLFFLHHTNLDRLWWEWQSEDLDTRLTDMGYQNIPSADYLVQSGFAYPGAEFTDYDGDAGNTTTLNHTLWMAGVIANATIADVMDLSGDFMCAEYV